MLFDKAISKAPILKNGLNSLYDMIPQAEEAVDKLLAIMGPETAEAAVLAQAQTPIFV